MAWVCKGRLALILVIFAQASWALHVGPARCAPGVLRMRGGSSVGVGSGDDKGSESHNALKESAARRLKQAKAAGKSAPIGFGKILSRVGLPVHEMILVPRFAMSCLAQAYRVIASRLSSRRCCSPSPTGWGSRVPLHVWSVRVPSFLMHAPALAMRNHISSKVGQGFVFGSLKFPQASSRSSLSPHNPAFDFLKRRCSIGIDHNFD